MVANILSGFEFTNTSVSMLMLLVKATLILVVALGITLSMQRASAGARHLVWLVTLATLLLVPALTAWAPIPLRILPAGKKVAVTPQPLNETPSVAIKTDKAAPVNEPPASITTPSTPASLESQISSSPVLSGLSVIVTIWAVVVLAIAASLGYAAMLVKRIVNRARPLNSEDWLNPLYEVSDRLSLEEPPRLLRSEDAKMPFACGVFTPTIVLPAECDTWTLDRRRAVLLHELAHVRRHDLVGHTLGRLACAFYWFHPLVWTAAKQLRNESERACDDLALACGARATDYAEHLLDIVTSVKRDVTPSVALAMARRKEFEGRMLAILDPDLRHSSPSRKQSATLIGSLALISIVVGAAAPAPRQQTEPARNVASPTTDLDLANYPIDGAYPNPKLEKKMKKSESEAAAQSASQAAAASTAQATSTQTTQVTTTLTQPALQFTVKQAVQKGMKEGMDAGQKALAQILGAQGAKSDTDERPILLARILTNDGDANLRRIAAWGLNEYADQAVAAEALAKALRNDRDPSVREMAAWALSDAGDRPSIATEALIAALHDSNLEVRQTAAWSLGNVGSRGAADALAAVLSDPNPEMRRRAAWALGNIDLKQAPPALINLLKDNDPETRETAAWALFQIEDPAAIGALEQALNREPDKELQIAYIRALAAVGEKSVDALKGLLESKDPEIRKIAVKALAGGHATGPWPRPWPQPRPFAN